VEEEDTSVVAVTGRHGLSDVRMALFSDKTFLDGRCGSAQHQGWEDVDVDMVGGHEPRKHRGRQCEGLHELMANPIKFELKICPCV